MSLSQPEESSPGKIVLVGIDSNFQPRCHFDFISQVEENRSTRSVPEGRTLDYQAQELLFLRYDLYKPKPLLDREAENRRRQDHEKRLGQQTTAVISSMKTTVEYKSTLGKMKTKTQLDRRQLEVRVGFHDEDVGGQRMYALRFVVEKERDINNV